MKVEKAAIVEDVLMRLLLESRQQNRATRLAGCSARQE
jgi:hypothetical protein